jgi:hypothetical protein
LSVVCVDGNPQACAMTVIPVSVSLKACLRGRVTSSYLVRIVVACVFVWDQCD